MESKLDKEQMTSEDYLTFCQSSLKANQKILEQNIELNETNKNWV